MLKINTSIACLALACIILSCNKHEQDKSDFPQSQVKQEVDSLLRNAEPLKNTSLQKTNMPNPDSLKDLKIIERKKRNHSLKALRENEVKIHAYYFHPTARCVTCRNIEAYSLEAVKQWEEKNKKKITWKELNIEDSLNEHFIEEFNLQFSSLIIVKYIGGVKQEWKNLEDTWKLAEDKGSLIKYVIHELDQFSKN